ncbi:hypothetical protein [Dysgonomonas macrotermitis]|uniref:Uncharacterized protein n=1 Tax=Dysgonomonas macrotermitis TaxID=1346286 RepID=A0A1M4U2K7_9BACT|nr:hypothetical protein [Dysgonomonas macrotermitis]SHE50860.1 hypothetical protein SAMN05444362_101488 [Dysgonomonas macrotermitis]
MLQQRKKDYLQRLIEEFFAKLQQLRQSQESADKEEQKEIIGDCLSFFQSHFGTKQSDTAAMIIEKIADAELLEQYAKILLTKYEIVDLKEIDQLYIALDLVRYLEVYDKTYSWDRTILKEDLLRILDTPDEN